MNVREILRMHVVAWAFYAMLPLPILLATDPAGGIEIKRLYLGLASALFSAEVFRPGESKTMSTDWMGNLIAVTIALSANAALFVALGYSIGVQSNLPLAALAILSVVPALGIVPWLLLHLESRYAAIILGATLVGSLKLLACVVARFVYGPNYIAEGYVSSDWRNAKLMIGLFWIVTVAVSCALLVRGLISAGNDSSSTPH